MLLLEGYLSYLSALGPWQLILVLALVLLIITNAKVLPFAWHVSFVRSSQTIESLSASFMYTHTMD